MKPHSSHSPDREEMPPQPQADRNLAGEPSQDHSLWDILGKASHQKPGAFFTRNVVRKTRAQAGPAFTSRILAIFTPTRLALSAAAFICILAAYQLWPTHEPTVKPAVTAQYDAPEPSVALAELVIRESLQAAAEDPSLFTHDELVAMIGF